MSSSLTGIAPLLRTTMKHDGRLFAPWVVFATVLSASAALLYPWIFPDQQERSALAVAVSANPALGLIFGPAFDLSTTDGFTAWRSLAMGGFLVALGSIFTVVRTTRGQEDSGQAELLASGVMGRSARLFTGVSLALMGSLAAGLVSGIVTALCGGDWQASLLLGATFTASGWMFGGIAAITAQLGGEARTANSLAVGTLSALFVLRGFAYAINAPEWMIWANPLGWLSETRPATGDHWWPLLNALALTVIALLVAFALQAGRDFGQGAIAQRPGPPRGRAGSSLALAVRLNRAPILTWLLAFVLLGIVFGYFATSVQDILSEDSAVAAILAAGATTHEELLAAFVVTILTLIGILAAIPGVQTLLKVHSEEQADRVEPILAGAVSRSRYLGSNVALAFVASAVYVMIAGIVVAAIAASANIGIDFGNTVWQATVTIPAVWTVIAVSVAVVGARPDVFPAAWVGVLISFALTLLGPIFRLWDWILAISPFWHVPDAAAADPNWWGLLWITLVTLLLLFVGFAGFRRRDLSTR